VTLKLPYDFDSTRPGTLILKGVLGLEMVFVAGILYSVVVSRNMAAVLGLGLAGGLLAFFSARSFSLLGGSVGTISTKEVVAQQCKVFGVRLSGVTGTFSVDDFRAIRVEQSSGPVDARGGPHERVYLVGKPPVPDILIARTDPHDSERGVALGRQLSELLNLPCVDVHVPY
jgi:hypothetical protein